MSTEEEHKAKEYYDSDDAYKFYYNIWGSENNHVAIYPEDLKVEDFTVDHVRQASRDIVDKLVESVPKKLSTIENAADLGSGFGGTARSFVEHAKKIDSNTLFKIDCFEVSAKENEKCRELNKEQGLSDRINVYDKSYLDTGRPDNSYDLIISEDAFLHCPDHTQLFKEINRILKPGGYLVFSDPMQTDSANEERLQPIYKRLHLSCMGSFGRYEKLGKETGLTLKNTIELSKHMKKHYAGVRKLLLERGKEFEISDNYIQSASKALQLWVDGVGNGDLAWGILVFQNE